MRVHYVVFDKSAFGITERSLKILRNELASRIRNLIAVVEIPTNDLCCTYLILDADRRQAVFTGDGFRTDKGGEGGAGHKTAEVLFRLFGVQVIPWDHVPDLQKVYSLSEQETYKLLLRIAGEIAGRVWEDDKAHFCCSIESRPEYIR